MATVALSALNYPNMNDQDNLHNFPRARNIRIAALPRPPGTP